MTALQAAGSAVVWRPTAEIRSAAALTHFMTWLNIPDYPTLCSQAAKDPGWFWDAIIRHADLRFLTPYSTILDCSDGKAWARWCVGGTTNLVLSCLDRPIENGRGDAIAYIWESETGAQRQWTFQHLHDQVGRLANALSRLDVHSGDRIGLYMPPLPEVAVAVFALAKIGAIVVPLFSGLGSAAIAERLNDVSAAGILTVDGTYRRGKLVAIKSIVDEAAAAIPSVRFTLVARSQPAPVSMRAGFDYWWDESLARESTAAPTLAVPAEHPFLIAHTSGTSGKPKGAVHSQIGLLAKAALDCLTADFRQGDRMVWITDPGWLGATMRILSSGMLGFSQILLEGVPDWPSPDRIWKAVERHRATLLGTSPTLVRSLMGHGDQYVAAADLCSLRTIFTTGESSDFASWMWLFHNVSREKLPILNSSGGTEIGGSAVGTTVLQALKPCTLGGGLPGMAADVLDERGNSVMPGQIGELVFRQPSICMTRGLYHDPQRYIDTYWSRFPDIWNHGDLVSIDEDGFWTMHGRSDDTIKVAGKRIAAGEIEALLIETGSIDSAAVVGVPDLVKGSSLVCVCVPAVGHSAGDTLAKELISAVAKGLGPAFRPKEIIFVSDLPRTRSMKLMRRAIRAVIVGEPLEDISSLANPEAIENLRQTLRSRMSTEEN